MGWKTKMDLLTSFYGFSIILYVFSFGLIGLFLRNSILRCRKNPITLERRRKGKFARDSGLLFSAWIFFFAALAVMNAAIFLQTYRIFTVGRPVAEISIKPAPSKDGFIIHLKELGEPMNNKTKPLDDDYFIRGDLWTIRGNIVRFKPTFNFLGMKPVYQLTRVQGDFSFIEDERDADQQNKRTFYSMIDPSREKWWRWMMKYSDSIPLVELTYGSSVTHEAKEGSRYTLTVLPSGFALEKQE